MDAVEFLKEAKSYCKWCKNTTQEGKRRLCEVCYFENLGDIFSLPPMAFRKFVETVEDWRKDHPIKTRQSKILEVLPNAKLTDDGILYLFPCEADETILKNGSCRGLNCDDCRRNYWIQEVE